MKLTVEILAAQPPGPPDGAAVIVQVRDVSYEDEGATTLIEKRTTAKSREAGQPFARVSLSVDQPGGGAIVWVHVDVDGDGEVSKGDYITMQSYPVRGGAMRVEVRRVG